MRGRTVQWGPVIVAAAIMGGDLGLTWWYQTRPPAAWLINHGVGFGLLAHLPWMADIGVGVGFAMLMAWYRFWPSGRYPLAVIGGGALANLVSRVLYGGVVDYWHWQPYPFTFNAADIAIRAGVVYLFLSPWFLRQPASRVKPSR